MKRVHVAIALFVAITAANAFADLTPLSDGVPVMGISGALGSEEFFVIQVPAARDRLNITISGGTGDADLYVRWNALPSRTEFDYRPWLMGNNELVFVDDPAGGMWYTMIRGYRAYAGLALRADYTPDAAVGATPDDPWLPVSTSGGWRFNFDVGNVGNPVYIDPLVAIGYDYFVDSGPNFAAVQLPTLGFGDNLYDLWSWDAGLTAWVDTGLDLTGGVQHIFGTGGVDRFRILGIEMPGLDPLDVTAFVTGLWFTGTGQVSMRQVPNVVPLPGAVLLGVLGLTVAGWRLKRETV